MSEPGSEPMPEFVSGPVAERVDKAAVEAVGRGVCRITDHSGQRIAFVAGSPEARWVFLDGQTYLVDVSSHPSRHRTGRQDTDALSSPMPATVASVHVAPGQRVAMGDVLAVVEAMKMELAIRAPRDGVVRAVRCKAGELVQPGVPLLELA